MMYSQYRQDSGSNMLPNEAPKYKPDEQAACFLLSQLNREELQSLLDNDSKLEELINDLDQVKRIGRDRQDIIVKNKSLAEYNLSMQPKLEELKHQVATGYEQTNQLKLALGKDFAKFESLSGGQSQDATLAILQAEAAKADEESEQIADDFCDNKITGDKFMEVYLPMRTQAHVRKTKAEKLSELIREHGSSSYTQPAYSGATTAPGMGPAPYPTGPGVPYPSATAGFAMPSPYPQYR